jgi:hypothetical protein
MQTGVRECPQTLLAQKVDHLHLNVGLHESLYCLMYYNVCDRVLVGETHDCRCRLTSSAWTAQN